MSGLLRLCGCPLAEIGTEAPDRAETASGNAARADVLTVENKGGVEAENHPFRNEPIEKEFLRFLMMLLHSVFPGKNAKAGQHTDRVEVSRKYVATKRVEHHRGSNVEAHPTE